MCGVCGVYSWTEPPDLDLVAEMTAVLHHRGPDGRGLYRDDAVALGHTRLAIVDTAGGAQPMTGEDGAVWVSFNGEIFNHVELRAELEALGHRFRTRSDTEVIVHAWEQWGEECFGRFNGQWAVAVRDRRARRLVLCRDRMGVRPLFYARTGTRLVFASEPSALRCDPSLAWEWDAAGVDEALMFWSAIAPRTVFAGVSEIPPGHLLEVDADGHRLRRWWQPTFPARGEEPLQDLREATERVREAVVAATRLRFQRADVPVGAYLSGGLDSAITASVIADATDAELHTFSLRFADAEYDEGTHQATMAARLGTVHREVVVAGRDIAAVFPDVVRHTGTVLLRTAPAPMYLLSRLARREGFPVVVTGEGADEVFAGYDLFRELRVREFLARDPDSPIRGRAVEHLYPWMARGPQRAPAFARGFFARETRADDPAVSHRPRWSAAPALRSLLRPELRTAPADRTATALTDGLGPESVGWDSLSRAQALEMATLLPGYLLSSQGDRMLMAHSVEGRFPFLDPEVVALGAALPARFKLRGLDEKHILKAAFSDLVPMEILDRPKQPYRSPDAACFFGEGAPDWVDAMLAEDAVRDAGIFHPPAVAALARKARASDGAGLGNTDNMRVTAVLSAQLLAAEHRPVVGGADRPRPVVHDLLGVEWGMVA